MKTRYILYVAGIILIILGVLFSFGACDKRYTRQEAIDNYNHRETEINELVNFFKQNKPADHEVSVGIGKNRNRFNIGIGLPRWAVMEKYPRQGGGNLKLNSAKMDTLLNIIKWKKEVLTTLMDKLKKSNCQRIYSDGDDAVIIDHKESSVCRYLYIVYDKPLSDSMMRVYEDAGIPILKNKVKVGQSCGL